MKYAWLDQYLLAKPGTEKDYKPEWGWHRYMLPGYYCDKRLWVAALLDGGLPDIVLKDLCDMSYELVVSKLPKYVQKELKGDG